MKSKPRKATLKIFKKLLLEEFGDQSRANKSEQKKLQEQIEKLNTKLGKARELLLPSEVDPKDYKDIKQEIEEQLARIEAKLVDAARKIQPGVRNVEQMTETALETLLKLDSIFIEADSEAKRQIVGSIFPEGLIITEEGSRTTRVNEVAAIICQINSDLYSTKTGAYDENSSKFRLVPATEQMSYRMPVDLSPKYNKLIMGAVVQESRCAKTR